MRAPSARPTGAAGHDRPLARVAAALLLSSGLNLVALAAASAAGVLRLPGAAGAPARVALAALGGERWEANRRIVTPSYARAPRDGPTAAPRPAPPPELPEGRVVRVAPSPDARRPPSARFLAERDNTVARETQWRGPAPPGAALSARPTAGAAGDRGIPLPGEEGESEESTTGDEGADAPEARIERARLALAGEPREGAARAAEARTATRAGSGGARREGRFDPRILPVGDGFRAAGGGSPPAERLTGIPDGDGTAVNTRAFRYAAFYQRVRESIAREWDPNRVWDARDPHDRLLGRVTRKVLVDIVLDAEGELREARLVRGSGIDFLDQECLRAISAAAPFPNPPRGLVGADGLVVLREWGLVFEWAPEALLDRLLPNR